MHTVAQACTVAMHVPGKDQRWSHFLTPHPTVLTSNKRPLLDVHLQVVVPSRWRVPIVSASRWSDSGVPLEWPAQGQSKPIPYSFNTDASEVEITNASESGVARTLSY